MIGYSRKEDLISDHCLLRSSFQSAPKEDSQRAEIERWLEANSTDQQQVKWYADNENGRTTSRPELDRLQDDMFSGKVKTIILWKLDRLSRWLVEGVKILSDWADRGFKVVVITQQLELNGTIGRFVAPLLMELAEIEWEYRRERQSAGIEDAKK